MAAPATDAKKAERVALVLGGGGARGAYEIGVLSVLLPRLKELGQSPNVILGTSIGALHAAYLAAHAEKDPPDALRTAIELWNRIEPKDVFDAFRPGDLPQLLGYLGSLIGVGNDRVFGMLDTDRLERQMKAILSQDQVEQIHRNVHDDQVPLDTVGVVATQSPTSRSIVFMCSDRQPPKTNALRGIRYVRTALTHEHVLASSSLPLIFPARKVTEPACAAGWYYDGGLRLNTPIKPALELGADRVIVVAMDSLDIGWEPQSDEQPDIADAAAQVLNAVLVDPIVQDVHTLAGRNEDAMNAASTPDRVIPYMFIAPPAKEIADRAWKVWQAKYRHSVKDLGIMGRALGGAGQEGHGEVLSHLMFDHDFTSQLVELGERNAQEWLGDRDPADPWETKRLEPAQRVPGPCDTEPGVPPTARAHAATTA